MTLKTQLTTDMKTAMKARDMETLGVIRFLLAEIKNVEIDSGEIDDARVEKIVASQIKKMKDAMGDFEKGGRQDLVEEEAFKVSVLEKYLPEQLSDQELSAIIDQVKADNPDVNQGQLIGLVLKQAQGKADGKRVSNLLA